MVDALNDELGDAVADLDLKVGVAVVEEQHLDGAPVVGVNDAGARVDEVVDGEAGAGGDAAVCILGRKENGHVSLDFAFSFSSSLKCLGGKNVQVPAGTAMERSVSTRPLPRLGITVSWEA